MNTYKNKSYIRKYSIFLFCFFLFNYSTYHITLGNCRISIRRAASAQAVSLCNAFVVLKASNVAGLQAALRSEHPKAQRKEMLGV